MNYNLARLFLLLCLFAVGSTALAQQIEVHSGPIESALTSGHASKLDSVIAPSVTRSSVAESLISREGNGGDAFEIKPGEFKTFDEMEYEERIKPEELKSYQDHIAPTLEILDSQAPTLSSFLRKVFLKYNNWFIVTPKLKPVPATGYSPIVLVHEKEQAAVTNNKRTWINRNVWNGLSTQSRAFLLWHEALWVAELDRDAVTLMSGKIMRLAQVRVVDWDWIKTDGRNYQRIGRGAPHDKWLDIKRPFTMVTTSENIRALAALFMEYHNAPKDLESLKGNLEALTARIEPGPWAGKYYSNRNEIRGPKQQSEYRKSVRSRSRYSSRANPIAGFDVEEEIGLYYWFLNEINPPNHLAIPDFGIYNMKTDRSLLYFSVLLDQKLELESFASSQLTDSNEFKNFWNRFRKSVLFTPSSICTKTYKNLKLMVSYVRTRQISHIQVEKHIYQNVLFANKGENGFGQFQFIIEPDYGLVRNPRLSFQAFTKDGSFEMDTHGNRYLEFRDTRIFEENWLPQLQIELRIEESGLNRRILMIGKRDGQIELFAQSSNIPGWFCEKD